MSRVDALFKSLFTLLAGVIFLDLAIQILISTIARFLPQILELSVVFITVTAIVGYLRRSLRFPRKPLIPPNTPSLGSEKHRRARSTGSNI